MESRVTNIFKWRPVLRSLRTLFPVRAYSDVPNLKKIKERNAEIARIYPNLISKYWHERSALKLRRKENSFPYSIHSATDLLKILQDLRNLPGNFTELYKFLKKRLTRRDMIDQQFLAKRELVLKPDLAAATFIVERGGSVKFFGQPNWVGFKEEKKTLPATYVPGFHVEALNAEGTNLCFEGLPNIRKLRYLKSLSLKGLNGINDWCLDYVSKEFYASLKHLDISNCINVTYRGLSCFYRFECLKSLNLMGVPDTPELKVACLFLLDIMPNLDIKGIDLKIPDKINPLNSEDLKHLSKEPECISGKTQPVLKEN